MILMVRQTTGLDELNVDWIIPVYTAAEIKTFKLNDEQSGYFKPFESEKWKC